MCLSYNECRQGFCSIALNLTVIPIASDALNLFHCSNADFVLLHVATEELRHQSRWATLSKRVRL